MSVAGLAVLLGLLTALNQDVRREVTKYLSNGQIVSETASTTRKTATSVVNAARFQTVGYASLVMFVVAAGVLFVFMLAGDRE
jgi:hypothetical protein